MQYIIIVHCDIMIGPTYNRYDINSCRLHDSQEGKGKGCCREDTCCTVVCSDIHIILYCSASVLELSCERSAYILRQCAYRAFISLVPSGARSGRSLYLQYSYHSYTPLLLLSLLSYLSRLPRCSDSLRTIQGYHTS